MTTDSGSRNSDTPFGVRLKAARKMAGLSMEDLANRLGGMVTKQAIGKYEKGRMMPSPEVLERLFEVLDKATWGASPLKEADVELAQPRLMMNSVVIRDEGSMAPLHFRRKRLLSGLLNRSVEPSAVELSAKEPERSSEFLCCIVTDNMASLADRRANYAPAREALAGPDKIRFREGEKLPAKSASALRYRLADYLERYMGLESLLGQTVEFENPVAGRPMRTSEEVEAAAAAVRRSWELGSGPVVNLLGLLEDKGVRVFETTGIEGFEGLSGAFGPVPFVAVSRDLPVDRVRFTAAHELAHLLCRFPDREGAEALCHAFAGAFLLPKAAVEKAFGAPRRKFTLGELSEVKATFGISLQAIMYRAKGLGLVSDRQFRAFRETVNARGWAVTEPMEYTGMEKGTRFRRLVHYAVAADILDIERAAQVAGVPASELKDEMGDIF